MSSQLKAISMKLSTAEINQSMVDALKGVNTVMEKVNASMDIHSIQQVLKEFAKQSEKMEMQQEMVSRLRASCIGYYQQTYESDID
jgi:charged multivesicular body protein 2A